MATVSPPSSARGFLQSEAMQVAVRGLRAAVHAGGGVLISGEPGTGRELFARVIHRLSETGDEGPIERQIRHEMAGLEPPARPFIVLDCSRSTDMEARLFGVDSGPNGGAVGELDQIAAGSKLHQACNGTLMLRHLPEMPRRLQSRLTRILLDGEAKISKNGHMPEVVPMRMRLMATMELPTSPEGAERLHPELARRLGSTIIHLPALRERREDIPSLARYLLATICARRHAPVKTLSNQAAALLSVLQWRGNLHELRGLLETLAARVPGSQVRMSDILACVRLDGRATTFSYGGTLREARERFEREYVAHILEQHHGRMGDAAKALGIQRTNLYRKVRQLSVQRRPGRQTES